MLSKRLLNNQDPYVDYIIHVENARKENRLRHMHRVTNNLVDENHMSPAQEQLDKEIQEYEDDLELLNFTKQCKSAIPVGICHANYACVTTDTALKQKSIKKLYLKSIPFLQGKLMAKGASHHDRQTTMTETMQFTTPDKQQQQFNDQFSETVKISSGEALRRQTLERQVTEYRQKNPNETNVDICKIMDQLQQQKNKQNNEQFIRSNYRQKVFSSTKHEFRKNNFITSGQGENAMMLSTYGFMHQKQISQNSYSKRLMSAAPSGQISNALRTRNQSSSGFMGRNLQSNKNIQSPQNWTDFKPVQTQRFTQLKNHISTPMSTTYNGPRTPSRPATSVLNPAKRSNQLAFNSQIKQSPFARSQLNQQYQNNANVKSVTSLSSKTRLQTSRGSQFRFPGNRTNTNHRNVQLQMQSSLGLLSNGSLNGNAEPVTSFTIPEILKHKVPRHWLTFVEDCIQDIQMISSHKYSGGVSKGEKHGTGEYVYPNGDIFKGSFRNGLRHGPGTCVYINGTIYKGEWREDKPSGNGTLFSNPNEMIEAKFDAGTVADGQVKILFTNGEFYEGNFKQNARNGSGNHYYRNGDSYEGEWLNDKRVRRGRIHQHDKAQMHGMFIEDKADGYVEFQDSEKNMFQSEQDYGQTKKPKKAQALSQNSKSSNLDLHQQAANAMSSQLDQHTTDAGSFTNGKLYNRGTITYHNGDKYRGNFKDGRPCGHGEMKYTRSLPGSQGQEYEEAEYIGYFKAGKREGHGKITWTDGTYFDGIWKNDMRHDGELCMSNGLIYKGTFVNDLPDGKNGRLVLQAGTIFEGQFEQGHCSTIGKLIYTNGDIYFGQHRNFAKEGQGKMVYKDGSVYEGGFEQEKRSRNGRLTCAETGDVYVGEFSDNKKCGKGRLYNKEKDEIYEGEWSQDKRQGEGTILNRNGEVQTGDFRADVMEGKLTFQRNLGRRETQKVFSLACKAQEAYIAV